MRHRTLTCRFFLLQTALALTVSLTAPAKETPTGTGKRDEPLRIDAPELVKLDFALSTGGLPVVPGLETFTVIRSNRGHPERGIRQIPANRQDQLWR